MVDVGMFTKAVHLVISSHTGNAEHKLSNVLTCTFEKLHFTNCKLDTTTILIHQYFLCVEINIDTDTATTCWLSTW